MATIPRVRFFPYGIAILTVALAVLVSLFLSHILRQAPFIFFWPAVIITIWYGGLRGGLLAIALTIFITGVVFPRFPFSLPHLENDALLTFLVLTGLISWFVDRGRRAEVALRKSQQEQVKLAAIVQSSDDAVISKDLNRTILSWNAGAERMYGYRAEEVIGKPISILVPPDMPDEIPQIMERLKRGERIDHYETQRITKDGRRLDVSLSISPLRDSTGQVIGAAKIARDVTERILTEAALRESDERYRRLFEDSPVSLWEQDFSEVKTYLEQLRTQGIENLSAYLDEHPEEIAACVSKVRVLDVNRAAVALYKAASKEDLLAKLLQVIPEGDMAMQKGFVLSVAEGKTVLEEELVNRTLEGDEIWIFLRSAVVSGYEETFGKVLVSITDITERKRAEEALRESDERYRTLFNSIEEGFCVIEKVETEPGELLDFRYVEANPAFAAQTGVGEVVGKTIRQAFPGETEEWFHTYDTILKTGEALSFERDLATQGRVLELYAFRVEEETHRRVAVIFKDITERKRGQDALRDSEVRLRTVMENMPVLLFAEEGDHKTVLWNAECVRVTGFRAEEVIGRQDGIDILYPDPDYRAYMLNFYNEHEGYYRNWETVATTKDGRQRIINWSNISPRYPVPGWTNWAVGIDITGRKRAEERTALLQRLSAALAAALIPEQVAEVVVTQGLAALGGSLVVVCRLDGKRVEILNNSHVPDSVRERHRDISLEFPVPITDAMRNGEPIWIETLDAYLTLYPHLKDSLQDTGSKSAVAIPLIADTRTLGAIAISFPKQRIFDEEERKFLLALAQQCAQALERARLYEAEQRARLEAERTANSLERLQGVMVALSEALTVSEVARIIVDSSVEALGATNGALNMLTDDHKMFELVYTSGSRLSEQERQPYQRFSVDLPFPVSEAMRTGQALWFESNEEMVSLYPAVAPIAAVYPGAWILIPLIAGGKTFGVYGLAFAQNRTFSEEEREYVASLAHQCAQALDRARLSEQEKQKAVLEERHRLARDLHDAVSQTLFAANVIAQSLPRLWERQPEKVNGRLDELARLTHGAAAEMRTLLVELRPETAVNNRLDELLQHFVAALRARRHIHVSLHVDETAALPEVVHVAIYRIAQETLNNIAKHSKASEVTIRLDSQPDHAELRIHDNGQGFDIQKTTAGLGLTSMRERAQAVSAALEIRSTPGQGTEVVLVWQATEPVTFPS